MPAPDSSPPAPGHIQFRIDAEQGLVLSTWQGRMTDAVMLDAYRRFFGSPAYDPTHRELADLRPLDSIDLSTVGLKKMAQLVKTHRRAGPIAILASDDLAFGLGRMYAVFGRHETERIEVFRDEREATHWLGLGGDALRQVRVSPAA